VAILREGIRTGALDPDAVHARGGHTLLQAACESNSLGAIQLLLDQGADPNLKFTKRDVDDRPIQRDSTALSYVKSREAAEVLLVHGADINARDSEGFTPLARASLRRDCALVEYFIRAGADLTSKQCVNGKMLSVRELVEHEASFYEKIAGATPSRRQKEFLEGFYSILRLFDNQSNESG
jgi:ankyrin repeat protein